MQTSKETEMAFREDLNKLLEKYQAEINITDDGKPYGVHNGVVRVCITDLYDKESFECLREYTEFLL